MANKIDEKIKLWFLVWTVGLFGGILFWILVITGRIELKGYKFRPSNFLIKVFKKLDKIIQKWQN